MHAVPDAYPTAMGTTFTLALASTVPTRRTLTVKTQTSSGAVDPGALVTVSGGPSSAYLWATSDATGTATFSIPSGSGYSVAATHGNRTGAGSWSGAVTSNVTANVRIG
jgi:hypothetical protein